MGRFDGQTGKINQENGTADAGSILAAHSEVVKTMEKLKAETDQHYDRMKDLQQLENDLLHKVQHETMKQRKV